MRFVTDQLPSGFCARHEQRLRVVEERLRAAISDQPWIAAC